MKLNDGGRRRLVPTLPYPGHSEIGRQLGDLHHLRPIGELLKNTQAQGELLFCVSIGLTLFQLWRYVKTNKQQRPIMIEKQI